MQFIIPKPKENIVSPIIIFLFFFIILVIYLCVNVANNRLVMAASESSLLEGKLIKIKSDPRIYVITAGKKHWIPDAATFNNYGYKWEDIIVVSESILKKYPRIKLVRAKEDSKIYYITESGMKRHIINPEVFNSYGNKWEDVIEISLLELNTYFDSFLIRALGDNKIYKIENGVKRWIKSAEAFNRLGYDWSKIAPCNFTEFNAYPIGESIGIEESLPTPTPTPTLTSKCGTLHEGTSDHSKAMDIIIVGAEDSKCKYSDKFSNFLNDASTAVNEFLSIGPYNIYKNAFNFYYSPEIIKCSDDYRKILFTGDYHNIEAACTGWEEAANNCNPNYDVAVVLVNQCLEHIETFEEAMAEEEFPKAMGGFARINFVLSWQCVPAFSHELSHILGLADEDYFGWPGPNLFSGLESCGKPLCEIQPGLIGGYKYTESSGGTCCIQLSGEKGKTNYYTTDERSVMKLQSFDIGKNFPLVAREFLKKVLGDITTIGYDDAYNKWVKPIH